MTRARRIALSILSIAGIAAVGLLNPTIGHAASGSTLLSGTVKSKSASGEGMEGVTVSAKIIGQTITTSVLTDDHGKYYFPPMENGEYWVWAQAVAFEAPRDEVELDGGARRHDFVMKAKEDFFSQLTGDRLIAALPEDTPAHRRMKDIFTRNCVACHEANVTLQNRLDEQGWEAIIGAMSRIGASGGFSAAAQATPALVHYQADLAAYLAEMRGPGPSPMNLQVPPRPSGDATLPVTYVYDIPLDNGGGYVPNNGSDWSLGPAMASGGGQTQHDAQVDFNGDMWFTGLNPATPDRTISKIDGKTGVVTNFSYMQPGSTLASPTHGANIAHDGTIWFNLIGAGQLGTIDPNTYKLEVFTPPSPSGGISIDEDGRGFMWAATNTGAVRLDRQTKEFTEFVSLTSGLPSYGMAGDHDGNGWWTEFNSTNWCLGLQSLIIGHSDIATGKSLEVPIPPNTDSFLQPGDLTPDDLTWYGSLGVAQGFPRRGGADKNGDDVWTPDYLGQRLVRINTHTLQVTFYPAPRPGLNPYMAGVDNSHNVWMNTQNGDELAKFDPSSKQWTLYSWPNRGTSSRGLHVLDRGGVVQASITYFDSSAAARMVMRTKEDIETLKTSIGEE